MTVIGGFGGGVLDDAVSRQLFATDASPCLKTPLAIAQPRSSQDCVALVKHCATNGLSVIPRGAGTSLAGQCLGDGIIVDVSRHLNRIISVDPEQRLARVEPGVVLADLNDALKQFNLVFPPHPSTATRCQIGGLIGNNAWGINAPRDGSTRDWVLALQVVLSDGTVANFGPPIEGHAQLSTDGETSELHKQIEQRLLAIVSRNRPAILDRYPSTRGIPNNAGYALDVLAMQQPWNVSGPSFNLAPFLCGSEGTLALTTEAVLRLQPLPAAHFLICVQFDAMRDALTAVPIARAAGATAVELLDSVILELTATNAQQRRNRFWLTGHPAAVLLIEFAGDNATTVEEQCQALALELRQQGLGRTHHIYGPPEIDMIWDLRRAGLGLLMGLPPDQAAVTGIEDSAVALHDLARFADDVNALAAEKGTRCVMYGSVSMGLIQFRPRFDLRVQDQRHRYQQMLSGMAELVQRYRGSFCAKHGDGRLRAPYLASTLGSQIVQLLREIKSTFDPHGIFNPGVVLSDDSDYSLRPAYTTKKELEIRNVNDSWPHPVPFQQAALKCHGAGSCLQGAKRGSMCPSFMATREELHSTRGRANVLAAMLNAPQQFALHGPEIDHALSLCLSCKACQSECPANVDMARLKAQVLHARHRQSGVPARTRLLSRFEAFSAIAGRVPAWSNGLLKNPALAGWLDLAPERALPDFSLQRFTVWHKQYHKQQKIKSAPQLVLLIDTHTEFFEPSVGIAAVHVLARLGITVTSVVRRSSGRLAHSLGLLDNARHTLLRTYKHLQTVADSNLPIVSLEPAELAMFRDEALTLFPAGPKRSLATALATRIFTLEEFILHHLQQPDQSGLKIAGTVLPVHVHVHVHCHEKALIGSDAQTALYGLFGMSNLRILNTPCCGMAGLFGYQRRNYALSKDIAELKLLPDIRAMHKDDLLVANGASCRQQIRHLTGRKVLHTTEILERLLNTDPGTPQ